MIAVWGSGLSILSDGDRRGLPADFGRARPPQEGSAGIFVEQPATPLFADGGAAGRAPEGEAHMEVYGPGGPQGPQPIYPRIAAWSVDPGQTVQAGAPRDQ